MTKKSTLLSLAVLILTIILFMVFAAVKENPDLYFLYKQRNKLFTLTHTQVIHSLNKTSPHCTQLKECALLPGDILIRRYITERTQIIDRLAHPYFTHSAFYLGDDQIIEAVGKEKIPANEIIISKLSQSDWYDPGIEGLVVIRPKNISQKINTIQNNLRNIAADPNYTFGIPRQETGLETGSKLQYNKATCADLIFKQLNESKLLQVNNTPEIITPDYLFWSSLQNPNNFEILSYWFSNKE